MVWSNKGSHGGVIVYPVEFRTHVTCEDCQHGRACRTTNNVTRDRLLIEALKRETNTARRNKIV